MSKLFILLIFTVMITNQVNSFGFLEGQAKIDSILKQIPFSKDDTNKVNLLNELSFNYARINPDEGIKFGRDGLELSRKIKWYLGEAKIYNSLGVIYSFGKSDYSKAMEYYQKALKINESIGNKSGIGSNLTNIGIIYQNRSDYIKALEYYQNALKMAENLGDKNSISKNLGNIGNIHSYKSDFKQALNYYQKALKIQKELGNKKSIGILLTNIGIVHKNLSNFIPALENFQNSLKIAEEIGDKRSIEICFGNIGELYRIQSNYPKALEYFNKALKIAEELGNKSSIALATENIGIIYSIRDDNNKALDCFLKALKIAEKLEDKNQIGSLYRNIGIIYRKFSNYTLAMSYYQKSLKIAKELGDKGSIAYNYADIGELYYILSQDSVINLSENKFELQLRKEINLKNSIKYSENAILILEEIGDLKGISDIENNLYEAYKAQYNYKQALEHYEISQKIKDSIFSAEYTSKIANLEASRENEIKDREIKLLQSEKKAQILQRYFLFGGIIILLAAFIAEFVRFSIKKKLSEKLALQKSEIEEQKKLVDEKNEQIYDSIRYASTIQHALMPWDITLKNAFKDYFIFFKPKDIVSGDCYWYQGVDGIKFLAVIDCTGHGIPGSMLTVIASSVLDNAVLSKRLTDTAEILTYMNDKVIEVLNQRLAENQIRDGMELALIAIKDKKIQFSGAGRPIYLLNQTFEILKTDRRGIAGSSSDEKYLFSSIEIDRTDNITLYLTSDGFADQMNENSKKFSTKRFAALLESISNTPMEEQNQILEYEFNSHKGSRNQIDDITILGVRI